MITKLVENKKRKANQYWPDASGEEKMGTFLEIGGGCRVELLTTSYQGSYHLRQIWQAIEIEISSIILRNFTIFMPNGDLKRVVQLQTKEWPDLTAPKEPRYNQKTLLQYFTFVPGFCWTLSTDLTTYQKKSVGIFSTEKGKTVPPQILQGRFSSTAAPEWVGLGPS